MASINISCPTTALSPLQESKNLKLFNGLHSVNPFSVNGKIFSLALTKPGTISHFNIKGAGRPRVAVISGEGDLLSYPNGNDFAAKSALIGDPSVGIEIQPDAIAFGTLSAETIPTTTGFPIDNDEFDLDRPTEGFSSIPEAVEDIQQGKMVIVVDDEDRENEGDLIMAASLATPEAMAFIVKHGTGIVCVSMKGEDLVRLQLPLMVTQKENEEKLSTAFTVSVDAKHGTTTGVSARDRATTVLALASKDSNPEDFNRPGHIFPLKYREGGVLKRAGHTEASVDLAVLAGLDPVAVLCEVVDDDGSMARLPMLRQFAYKENLKIISIADLIRKMSSEVAPRCPCGKGEMLLRKVKKENHNNGRLYYKCPKMNEHEGSFKWLDDWLAEQNKEPGQYSKVRETVVNAKAPSSKFNKSFVLGVFYGCGSLAIVILSFMMYLM